MTRWFENIGIDEVFPLGSYTFTEAEIIRFGTLYDPQYFHVDPEAAKESHFGGLVASGWHTVSVGHRRMVGALEAEEERLRGLGEEPAGGRNRRPENVAGSRLHRSYRCAGLRSCANCHPS